MPNVCPEALMATVLNELRGRRKVGAGSGAGGARLPGVSFEILSLSVRSACCWGCSRVSTA